MTATAAAVGGAVSARGSRAPLAGRSRRAAGALLLAASWLALPAMSLAQASGGPGDRLKKEMADRGLTFGLSYLGEVFSIAAGGLRRGPVDLHNVSLTLSLDLHEIAGWRGATAFFYGMGIAGGDPDRYIGDLQGVSNIAAPAAARLYEAWLQQDLWGGRLSLLAGIYDLNSEFAVLEPASVFLNNSQGIDPTFAFTGLNGPSVFPFTTLGVRARLKAGGFYVQTAVMNGLAGDPGDPDATRIVLRAENGVLLAGEAGYHFPLAAGRHRPQARRRSVRRYVAPAYADKIALGLWTYTARFAPILAGPSGTAGRRGNAGLYILLSHTVWRETGDAGRRLMTFARVGVANPRLNRLGFSAAGGLSFTGLIRSRGQDIAGLALAAAFNGDDYLRSAALSGTPVRRAEWNLELTYQARILPWLDVHPDVQYVIRPGMSAAVPNALGLDIRIEISL